MSEHYKKTCTGCDCKDCWHQENKCDCNCHTLKSMGIYT